jgi:diphosphomevalonate decarboxylase
MADANRLCMVTVSAPTNIAVIKYWGKANVAANTPINSSLSVTLDQADLRAVTSVAASPSFTGHQLWINGVLQTPEAVVSGIVKKNPHYDRFLTCINAMKALAQDQVNDSGEIQVSQHEFREWFVHVSSYNTFPTAAGLASSAAGYAALVFALGKLYHATERFPGEWSTIARQGSGSACRSLYGGGSLIAWRHGSAGEDNLWNSSVAEPIIPANTTDETLRSTRDWWQEQLCAVICVVHAGTKHVSSSAGMQLSVATSPLLAHRAAVVVPQRMVAMEAAWKSRDFGRFAELTMQDSNQFHATCLDTYPPIVYLTDTSHAIVRLITAYNQHHDCNRAAYTFDAGPNAVLYCLKPHLVELTALILRYFPSESESYLSRPDWCPVAANVVLDPALTAACDAVMPGCAAALQHIYITRIGPGPQVLSNEEHGILDPVTGLNTYAANK